MKHPGVMALISANLIALVGLAFVYPQWMVGPGPVVAAHAGIATECFACHAPFGGASQARCVGCHALSDIGLRSTKGLALAPRAVKTSFHQDLIETDCLACHSDHPAVRLTHRHRSSFTHALLRAPALARCEGCHTAPSGSAHPTVTGQCGQCHSTEAWKPAQLDHGKFFELDRDHAAPCVTCHTSDDYKRYTCYGCHEHTPEKVRAEHEEEGITNLDDCVGCHRSASDKPKEHGKGGKKEHED